jgi:hypothetical protein
MARLRRGYTGERRTARFTLQLTPSERRILEELARQRGMVKAELVRSYLPIGRPIANDADWQRADPERVALVGELSRVGNNLNQLTKLAHQSGLLPEENVLREVGAELKAAFKKVM